MSRLSILTEKEQQTFEQPPILSPDIRAICFALTPELDSQIQRLRTPTNQVGFLLQYGYFKVCGRFFSISRLTEENAEYACHLLGIDRAEVNLSVYKERILALHQKNILSLLDYTPFDNNAYEGIKKEITRQFSQHIEPKAVFLQTLEILKQQKIECPSYHRLAELITLVYAQSEDDLLLKVEKQLTPDNKTLLKNLILENNSTKLTILNQFKLLSHSTKPKAIQASLEVFKQIKNYFLSTHPIIETLNLSTASSTYYAKWVNKAQCSQLKQFPNRSKLYLHLLAFIQYQFYSRQDYYVDILLKSVQAAKNMANKKLMETDKVTRHQRQKATQHLAISHRGYRNIVDEIHKVVQSPLLTDTGKVQKIREILDEHEKEKNKVHEEETATFEQIVETIIKNNDYYDVLEKCSISLQRRISDIIKVLTFHSDTSDSVLIRAIEHFRKNEGDVTSRSPTDFLEKEEKTAVLGENKKLRVSLYKILLFIHVAEAIKSGRLNLAYSFRYLSIKDYLIDEVRWKSQRDDLLKMAGLSGFSNFTEVMNTLKERLDQKYQTVNERFIEKKNPYLLKNKKNNFYTITPALENKDTEYIGALLEQVGYVPLLQILSDIDKIIPFISFFKHLSVKHVKQRPSNETYLAGIMSLGCNIGLRKMAQISVGVNEHTLLNTVTWYFDLKNIQAANQQIIRLINQLTLSSAFVQDNGEIHSSSDGRKVNVGVDSLMANCSFKYFGKNQGVSVYTFIDDRQALFHSLVMSPTEREAAYVIDGLLQNEVVQTHIHSTDTHGFTEAIFAATHFLGIAFAPRIKKVGKQTLYAFSSKKTYEKRGYSLLPSRTINQKLLEKQWEDLLRFMVTIKLKEVTASQLFKRLSSYAKDNPLYKALKEMGRIIKTLFILTYFDDTKLRQRIEKQLNRIELSNKFSNAVFFANDREFKQAEHEAQEIATACKVLIQNAIVLWNYLYLSQLLANCQDQGERHEIINMIKKGSIITWRHINLHGEYDFRRPAANESRFDMEKILSLKLAN